MYHLLTRLWIVLKMMVLAPFCTVMGALHTGFKGLLGEKNMGSTAHAWNHFWAWAMFTTDPIQTYRFGMETVPRDQPFVVVANHASTLDILLLLGYLPLDFRFVSKRILMHILWAMRVARYIPVDRDGSGRDWDRVRSMGGEMLQSGRSVLIFPEGRRSRDGSLGDFKPGAFRLAIENGVAILPVAICGTIELMPHDALLPRRPGPVGLSALAPISTAGLTEDDLEALMAETRERLLEGVDALTADVAERYSQRPEWLPV